MALCGLCGKFTMQFPALQTEKETEGRGSVGKGEGRGEGALFAQHTRILIEDAEASKMWLIKS